MLSFFSKFIYLFLVGLGLPGLPCYEGFSLAAEWELFPSCGAQASHCGGFSCCRA